MNAAGFVCLPLGQHLYAVASALRDATGKRYGMVEVIERIEGHYDASEVAFGTVYRWCPECLLVQCDCGETATLTCSESMCPWCGTDHSAVIREKSDVGQQEDETVHPWRYAGDREDAELPC
jgi:hypothetical protein